MKRWFANYLLRLAFRIFRRYHDQLPKDLNEIIWGEMTRKPEPMKDYLAFYHPGSGYDPACSQCVREWQEDRANQETVTRWLKGEG